MELNDKNEAGPLLPSATSLNPKPRFKHRKTRIFILSVAFGYMLIKPIYDICQAFYSAHDEYAGGADGQACAQVDALAPVAHAPLWGTLNAKISTPAFEKSAVDWLAGAVRVPYVSFFFCLGCVGAYYLG